MKDRDWIGHAGQQTCRDARARGRKANLMDLCAFPARAGSAVEPAGWAVAARACGGSGNVPFQEDDNRSNPSRGCQRFSDARSRQRECRKDAADLRVIYI